MSKQEIIIDPEFRDWLPVATEDEDGELTETIRADGKIIDPLIVWKKTRILVDGHRRKKIADALGIGYRVEEKDFPDRASALIWAYDHQDRRRNFTDYQRTVMALKMEPLLAVQAAERMKSGGKTVFVKGENTPKSSGKPQVDPVQISAQGTPSDGKTRTQVADIAGISHDTVGKVKIVEQDGTKALREMAASGDVSISAAATVARALPKDEQRKIAAQGPEAVKVKAAEIREEKKAPAKRDRKPKTASAEKSEPEEAEPVYDGLGEVVTDPELIVVFQNAAKFDHILSILNQVSKGISELTGNENDMDGISGGEELAEHRQKLRNDYVNLRTAVKFAKPYATCPYAHIKGQKCNACHGLGWVVKDTYTRAPEELKSGKGAA